MPSLSGPRARRIAALGAAAAALATAAGCDYPPDGTPAVVVFAGSPITEDVDDALVAASLPDPDPDGLFNVHANEPTPRIVPADDMCGVQTFHTPPALGEIAPPTSSTTGRNALRASVLAGDGCYDIARSALPPRPVPTDPATFRYYAYGLDAVGWATASPFAPPLGLSTAQLRGIYNCTFTNWNQLGGGNAPIDLYVPPVGSDLRTLFVNEVLGFEPGVFCPVTITPENTGSSIAANGDLATAIVPFSGSQWNAMANGLVPDERFGLQIRNLDGRNITFFDGTSWVAATPVATGSFTAPVQESNVRLVDSTPSYVGVSYAWHVVDTSHVSYPSARRFVGFDNVSDGLTSPLCRGARAAILEQYGFGPLDDTAHPLHNLPGSTCREWSP